MEGKVCLVTGASSGIGAATAEELARRGARLALTGRDEAELGAVAARCQGLGAEVLALAGDLRAAHFPESLVAGTLARYGRLDVLVNNAGTAVFNNIRDYSQDQVDEIMQVNLYAVMHLSKAAAPHLIESKGNIVNVSSIAGLRALPGLLAYSLSKGALEHLTRSMALELAPDVRVNTVSPGTIGTKIQKRMGLSDKEYVEYLEKAKSAHALARIGTPEEVAATIAFLASPAASFITGVSIPVDGGRHIMCPTSFN